MPESTWKACRFFGVGVFGPNIEHIPIGPEHWARGLTALYCEALDLSVGTFLRETDLFVVSEDRESTQSKKGNVTCHSMSRDDVLKDLQDIDNDHNVAIDTMTRAMTAIYEPYTTVVLGSAEFCFDMVRFSAANSRQNPEAWQQQFLDAVNATEIGHMFVGYDLLGEPKFIRASHYDIYRLALKYRDA